MHLRVDIAKEINFPHDPDFFGHDIAGRVATEIKTRARRQAKDIVVNFIVIYKLDRCTDRYRCYARAKRDLYLFYFYGLC